MSFHQSWILAFTADDRKGNQGCRVSPTGKMTERCYQNYAKSHPYKQQGEAL